MPKSDGTYQETSACYELLTRPATVNEPLTTEYILTRSNCKRKTVKPLSLGALTAVYSGAGASWVMPLPATVFLPCQFCHYQNLQRRDARRRKHH